MEKFTHGGVEYTLPTPNGLMFESKAVNYQLIVRSRRPIYDSGVMIGEERELTAEFGDTDAPAIHDEDTGEDYYMLRGHFIDTLLQGWKKEWTDDERALVEKKLLASQQPGLHWLHAAPRAQRPWPTYDEMAAKDIAAFAISAGLVSEASAYERENKNRTTVLEALQAGETEEPAEVEVEELAV